MSNYYKSLNPQEGFDKVTEEIVVTEGYFSGKKGILYSSNILFIKCHH